MAEEWKRVSSSAEVLEELELDGVGTLTFEQLLLAPESARYLRTETEMPQLPPGQYGLMVPRTRYFFNVSACRELRGDIVVALGTFLATHNAPAAAAIAALRKLQENLKRLSPEELALVRVIVSVCPGNPYKEPVAEVDIGDASGESAEKVNALLDSLQNKGVLSARREGRVQLTY
jgi:hypothetical protein